MFTSFMLLIGAAVLSGQEPPLVVGAYKDVASCHAEAAAVTKDNAAKLAEMRAAFVCVTIVRPTI